MASLSRSGEFATKVISGSQSNANTSRVHTTGLAVKGINVASRPRAHTDVNSSAISNHHFAFGIPEGQAKTFDWRGHIHSVKLYPSMIAKRNFSSRFHRQKNPTVEFTLKELIEELHDNQTKVVKQLEDSVNTRISHLDDSLMVRFDSLKAESQAGRRAVNLHLKVTIGLWLLTVGTIVKEWVSSGGISSMYRKDEKKSAASKD